MEASKKQKKRKFLTTSQCRFFKLGLKLNDPDDEIGRQEIISTISQPPFRLAGSLKSPQDRMGVLKKPNLIQTLSSSNNFNQLLSRTFLTNGLEFQSQKFGERAKQLSPYIMLMSKLKNLPKEYQNIMKDNRPSVYYSFSYKGIFYAASLRPFKINLSLKGKLLETYEFTTGWTRFLTTTLSTGQVSQIMKDCITIIGDKIKLQQGKLYKKCSKSSNSEKQYRQIERWQIQQFEIGVEAPLIQISNPEIQAFEVICPDNHQILNIVDKGFAQIFNNIKKRINMDKLIPQS